MLQFVPNLMTLGNLLCGCAGIWALATGQPLLAAYWMWAAAVLDFGDGFVARAVGASSELGKQLDSLADLVTFGVLPAFIAAYYLNLTKDESVLAWNPGAMALPIAAMSCLRLARFNIDTQQHYGFLGVPTPANALLFSALPFLWVDSWQANGAAYLILIAVILIQSFLLVSDVPLLAMKIRATGLTLGQRVVLPAMVATAALAHFLLWQGWGIVGAYVAYLAVSILFPDKKEPQVDAAH